MAAVTIAACCSLGGVAPAAVGAQADSRGDTATLDVDAVLDGQVDLDDATDVAELDRVTSSDDGERLVVISDAAGPGGMQINTVVAPPGTSDALADVISDVDDVLDVAPDVVVAATGADPYAVRQYSPRVTGADRLPSNATGAGVLVAVIDSGVDAAHPDLAPPLPGGRTRVLRGTAFSNGPTGLRGDIDAGAHGTHVAGIIAAARGNSLGISGAAPDAQILPVRVLDASGVGSMSDVLLAIQYAHAQGADVINLSLAGAATHPDQFSLLDTAIDRIRNDTSRGKPAPVIVAAAGNSGPNSPTMYPAAHPLVIAVGSTNAADQVTATSTRGSWIDLAAPGDAIVSTCGSGAPSYFPAGSYCYMSGTSMASPLVAAAAALLLQQSPGRSPGTVQSILQSSSHDIDAPGHDRSAGSGRLDVAAAYGPIRLPEVPRPVQLPTGQLLAVRSSDRAIIVEGTAGDPDGAPSVFVQFAGPAGWGGTREGPSAGGSFSLAWEAPAGEHLVCTYLQDNPTLQGVSLGCANVVVK